jgi:hypothetical protein
MPQDLIGAHEMAQVGAAEVAAGFAAALRIQRRGIGAEAALRKLSRPPFDQR